ncbi:FlgO family outer membrane protein [Rheinheimera sp.]|uniref:FlgO family outer membrane protein n=1 Tax=Rheinheimera sp. TaxID=1869214 RepID=UPI00307E5C2E
MRWILPALVLIGLAGCSQTCDCDNPQTAQQNNAEPVRQDSDESLYQQDFVEAVPASSEPMPEQFDALLAEERKKGPAIVAYTTRPARPGEVGTPVPEQLRPVRATLPSEQGGGAAGLMGAPLPYSVSGHKKVSDYAEQLAFKLAANDKLTGSRVAVVSFVEFDHQLEQSNPLGQQMAEALVTRLPDYQVAAIEYKLGRKLRIGEQGDYALSRDLSKLRSEVQADYVLVGTLVPSHRGVQINARVVSAVDQAVISAGQVFIPHSVLEQMRP